MNQQVRQLDSSLVILGTQFDGAGQFLVGAVALLQMEVGFSKLEVRIGVARIDLDGIGKLDRRFLVFPFRKVVLAALKVLLLAHVGIH